MNRASRGQRAKFLIPLLLALMLIAGCHRQPQSSVPPVPLEPTPPEENSDGETIVLRLHFVQGGRDEIEQRSVPSTLAVARAAILELAKGSVRAQGELKVLPPGTRLRDIAILDGIAYVDFPGNSETIIGAVWPVNWIPSIP